MVEGECVVVCVVEGMDYVSVAEEEGGELIEIPVEEDGTGGFVQLSL